VIVIDALDESGGVETQNILFYVAGKHQNHEITDLHSQSAPSLLATETVVTSMQSHSLTTHQ
jgi:hypothetical protein